MQRKFRAYNRSDLEELARYFRFSKQHLLEMMAVSAVFPFRCNNYVIEELIDLDRVPEDPMFQLTFPQAEMLEADELARMIGLIEKSAPEEIIQQAAREIQDQMNPHPAGQVSLNVPRLTDEPLSGMQHKYRETVLFFPSQGQTCHAYCAYCFRWPQFVGIDELKFASHEANRLVEYVQLQEDVTSVLITGGDPLIMKSKVLRRYIEPLLDPRIKNLLSIRIGTKAPAYWPFRFLTDPDADDLLRLFEEVRDAGRTLAIMAHYTHPRELETEAAQAALRRIQDTGAIVRCQSPLIKHVNDDADAWVRLWRHEIKLGAIPYYMFVQRDTGPRSYFEVPLARAHEIFREAYQQVSGLGRTVRGPSMSATPGKIVIDGITDIHDERVFVLKFLQARNPDWVGRPFFAQFDEQATWLDQLRPALGENCFFFEES